MSKTRSKISPTKNSKKSRATEELWRRGNLRYKLRPVQLEAHDFVRDRRGMRLVLAMHRGAGKSYFSCVLAIETALRGGQVKCVAPSAKLARQILFPHMREILSDCPADLRPSFRYMDGAYRFPSGGTIMMAGSESGSADALRGTDTDLAILDEAGFMSDLGYIEQSVILPRLLPRGGTIVYPSTPATSPSHPYSQRMYDAERHGYLLRQTVFDNPELTPERIAIYARESGGQDTTAFRREYLCEIVTEETAAVVPESGVVRTFPETHPGDEISSGNFTAIRARLNQLSVALFCSHRDGRLHVEDEWHRHNTNTDTLVEALRSREEALWGDVATSLAPIRIADDRGPLSADLGAVYGLPTVNVGMIKHYDDQTALGELRGWIASGRIVVHEKCTLLLRHLRDAVWNDGRTDFGDSGDGGRFDALKALMLVVRILPAESKPPDSKESRDMWRKALGRHFF